MNFGRAINRCRKSKELNQREFADRCSLSKSIIGYYETGERGISAETLALIARELNIPLVLLVHLASDTEDLKGINGDLNHLLDIEVLKYLGLYDYD